MPESAAARPSRSPVVPGVIVRAEPSSSSLSSRRIGTVRAGVPTRIVQRPMPGVLAVPSVRVLAWSVLARYHGSRRPLAERRRAKVAR